MAKSTNGLGQFSGKLGSVVFAVSNGQQSVRQYQPIVNNPKTALQNAQRAKGNLAGRISSFVPRTAIIGLGSNNRLRRGEFLRNILTKAEVDPANNFDAKIKRDDIIFSKGAVLSIFLVGSIGANERNVGVALSTSTALDPTLFEAGQGRLVVMVYDTNDNLVEVATRLVNKPTAIGQQASTTLFVNQSAGYNADIYLIPMSTADGSSVAITSDMARLDDTDVAALLSANRNAVVFEYGRSIYIGTAQYTPAP